MEDRKQADAAFECVIRLAISTLELLVRRKRTLQCGMTPLGFGSGAVRRCYAQQVGPQQVLEASPCGLIA